MNRDRFEHEWESRLKDESSIRNFCNEVRYQLLWVIRYFLEDTFRIDLDDRAINSESFKLFYEGEYKIHDVNTSFERIKSYSLMPEEETLILAGLYYLISCCELDIAFLNSFNFTIANGLKRIIRSRTFMAEDTQKRIAQDKSVDDIIDTFSQAFE